MREATTCSSSSPRVSPPSRTGMPPGRRSASSSPTACRPRCRRARARSPVRTPRRPGRTDAGRRSARIRSGTARSQSARTARRPPRICWTRLTQRRRRKSVRRSTRNGDLMTNRTRFPLPPFTRRQFLTGALATGALTGIPAGLRADDRRHAAKVTQPRLEQRDYFFNFAHEADHQTATYYLVGGGTRVRLNRAQDHPGVLKQHRKKNKFLQNVPDDQLTHFVQNVRLSADFVTMSYVIQGGNTSAGTWNMSAMYFLPPMDGIAEAAALSVERAGASPIPLSAKRALYGHAAAITAEDLIEEA